MCSQFWLHAFDLTLVHPAVTLGDRGFDTLMQPSAYMTKSGASLSW